MLARVIMRQSVRHLSLTANRLLYDDLDERIYRENYIKYSETDGSFSEHTRTFYTDVKLKHRCIRDTGIRDTDYIRDTDCIRDTGIIDTDVGGMCQKCKGSGLIYPTNRITKGVSDYKLCEMCRGSGFR